MQSNVQANLVHKVRARYPGPRDQRAELLHGIASSATFRKSNRLREFLLFIAEPKLADPECFIREQEIWVEVFHRPANFDASEDTLVRVHASQLRKKLQQYFSEEGKAETITIELAKSGYTPVFLERVEMRKSCGRHPAGGRCACSCPGSRGLFSRS